MHKHNLLLPNRCVRIFCTTELYLFVLFFLRFIYFPSFSLLPVCLIHFICIFHSTIAFSFVFFGGCKPSLMHIIVLKFHIVFKLEFELILSVHFNSLM